MSYELRLLIVALTAFAVTNFVASGLVAGLWTRLRAGDAAGRAGALLRLRSLPAMAAVAAAVYGAVAFLLFEPREQDETFGVVLMLLAGVAAALIASGVWRAWRFVQRARRIQRAWLDQAEPIGLSGVSMPAFAVTSAFPIVAVVGFVRPTLIVARSVMSACTAGEMRAILAHEQGHVTRRDNLARAALAVLPDILGWLPASRRLAASWHQAAEDAADDCAASAGPHGRLTLASALIRVARIAPASAASATLPATALYRGDDIARRVRRLLDPLSPPATRRAPGLRRALAAACLLAAGALAMERMHDLVEALVTLLP
jgi:Zn-dependent protease with chaperone function